jgi:hypothetical protein
MQSGILKLFTYVTAACFGLGLATTAIGSVGSLWGA